MGRVVSVVLMIVLLCSCIKGNWAEHDIYSHMVTFKNYHDGKEKRWILVYSFVILKKLIKMHI